MPIGELRDWKELQRAHDLLVGIITDQIPHSFPIKTKETFAQWASVLCWALKHDHQNAFPENLAKLEEYIERLGFTLEDSGN